MDCLHQLEEHFVLDPTVSQQGGQVGKGLESDALTLHVILVQGLEDQVDEVFQVLQATQLGHRGLDHHSDDIPDLIVHGLVELGHFERHLVERQSGELSLEDAAVHLEECLDQLEHLVLFLVVVQLLDEFYSHMI